MPKKAIVCSAGGGVVSTLWKCQTDTIATAAAAESQFTEESQNLEETVTQLKQLTTQTGLALLSRQCSETTGLVEGGQTTNIVLEKTLLGRPRKKSANFTHVVVRTTHTVVLPYH